MAGKRFSKNQSPPAVEIRFFLVAIGIVFYLLLFFQASFTPLASFFSSVPSRAFLFTLVFNPSLFVELWCGQPIQFAMLDRIPLFFMAACGLLAAYGMGQITLRVLRITEFLDSLEQTVFSTAIGLSLFSTFLLVLGLCGLAGQCWLVRGLTAIPAIYGARTFFTQSYDCGSFPLLTQRALPSAVCGLLLIPYLLAFPLPPAEYDVVSYHLPGVKETFLTGDFGFRTDSVYVNMPFGAEMYYLWGMLLYGEWYHGALVGKILVGFTGSLLPAVALFAFGRRFFTGTVGIIAAILFLTTPWVYYVSVTGLIDCVCATYLLLAVYALAVFQYPKQKFEDSPRQPLGLLLLSGFLAGSAVSCKYPALLFVVVPLATFVWFCSRARKSRNIVLFSLAALLACGLWFGKNAAFTGNPTYPLLHNVFGDRTGNWTPEKNARWTRAHSPHGFTLSAAYYSATQILWKSDCHSPVLVPLATCGLVPIFFRFRTRKHEDRLLLALAAHIFFVLLCWWFLTHRLDRFWVPILPLVAILAAKGAVLSDNPFWKRTVLVVIGVTVAYSTLLAALPQPGKYNRFFLPMQAMRTDPIRVMPWTQHYNDNPPQGTLLLIGEAKAFDFNVPVMFSSCFDDSLFEKIVKGKSPEEIRRLFREHGISDIYVDWGEIARFRSPGNYGFSEFITPDVFDELVRQEVLVRNGKENAAFKINDR